METTKHTPGPWIARIEGGELNVFGDGRCSELNNQIGHLVKTMNEQAYDFQTEIDRLKEVNKELLEALKEVTHVFKESIGSMSDPEDQETINKCQSAIAKHSQS